MILIPSPHFSSVPKFNVREGLYEDKFVLSGFILHSLATEKELRNTLETAFMDKFAFTPVENKFEFVRAVEKKIVKIRSTDEITGEVLKHFCGSRGPIYIGSTTDLTALLTNRNLLKQDPNRYYPTFDELDECGEPMEEATTINTTQSSNTVSAAPVSSMIAFETPVPTTNVLPSPAVSVSSSPSVPASTNAVPPLKDASIYTKPAFSDVIHSIPSHKCPICKEMYVKTDIEAHVDICLEISNSVSSSIFASFVQRKHFSSKDKKVFNVRRSNLVKDVLAKCKLFFRDSITPIHVKFVEDPNTTDAGGPLTHSFLRASSTVFILQKRKSICV